MRNPLVKRGFFLFFYKNMCYNGEKKKWEGFMTVLRQKALNLLENIPDDYIEDVINLLENFQFTKNIIKQKTKKEHSEAYKNLEKFFGRIDGEVDCKKDLEEMLLKKYEDID